MLRFERMNLEIERKFLLANSDWKQFSDEGTEIKQGYFNTGDNATCRVRTRGDKGFLTIKGKPIGISRTEFEYEIPKKDAIELLKFSIFPIIEKRRFLVKWEQRNAENTSQAIWEIDVFEGENKGLTVAEIELSSDDEVFEKPDWLGKEVSHENKYFNSCLARNPFKNWK